MSNLNPITFQNITPNTKYGVLRPVYDGALPNGPTGSNDFSDLGALVKRSATYYEIQKVNQRIKDAIINNPVLEGLVNFYASSIGTPAISIKTKDTAVNTVYQQFVYNTFKRKTFSDGSSWRKKAFDIHTAELSGDAFIVILKNGKLRWFTGDQCGSNSSDKVENELNGIGYKNGAPVYYRFGAVKNGNVDFKETVTYKAENVIHICGPTKVEGRGVGRLASVLGVANDLYMMICSKAHQVKEVNNKIGVINVENPEGYSLQNVIRDRNSATKTHTVNGVEVPYPADLPVVDENNTPVRTTTAGEWDVLKANEKLTIHQSTYAAADFTELLRTWVNLISTTLGINPELYLMGFKDLSYAGWKGLGTHWGDRRYEILANLKEDIYDRVYEWVITFGVVNEQLPVYDEPDADEFYWTFKSTNTLDPERAAKATKLQISTGLISLGEALQEDGKWIEDELERRKQEYIMLLKVSGQPTDGVIIPLTYLLTGSLPEGPINAVNTLDIKAAIKDVLEVELTPDQETELVNRLQ